jgi:hypothetical protein
VSAWAQPASRFGAAFFCAGCARVRTSTPWLTSRAWMHVLAFVAVVCVDAPPPPPHTHTHTSSSSHRTHAHNVTHSRTFTECRGPNPRGTIQRILCSFSELSTTTRLRFPGRRCQGEWGCLFVFISSTMRFSRCGLKTSYLATHNHSSIPEATLKRAVTNRQCISLHSVLENRSVLVNSAVPLINSCLYILFYKFTRDIRILHFRT